MAAPARGLTARRKWTPANRPWLCCLIWASHFSSTLAAWHFIDNDCMQAAGLKALQVSLPIVSPTLCLQKMGHRLLARCPVAGCQPERKAVAGRGQRVVARQHSRGLAKGVQARLQPDAAAAAAAPRGCAIPARCQQVDAQLPRSVHRLCVEVCEAAHQGAAGAAAAAANWRTALRAAAAAGMRTASRRPRHGQEQLLQRGEPAHVRCQACRAAGRVGVQVRLAARGISSPAAAVNLGKPRRTGVLTERHHDMAPKPPSLLNA